MSDISAVLGLLSALLTSFRELNELNFALINFCHLTDFFKFKFLTVSRILKTEELASISWSKM